ncbi:pyroglutamyl-peptidase 1-like [Spodoptera litura]|uniref:Pyroglutamyl-peptidase 1-like n=1 Tax=Spodoptera litura TaxID=69820 RepID=A0A9J7DXM3_SPOLT|nr:pyroglutamyl-peptidase 1-like [Spodoptera litura]
MGTKRVLLTGFGPFPGAETNVSWEGVKSLNKEEIENELDINLFQEQIEVRYGFVDGCVPKLWAKYQPDLTIHVGVKPGITTLALESQASREGYDRVDTAFSCPVEQKHSCDGPEVIRTELSLKELEEQFNKSSPVEELKAEVSIDAGKYVCEYTYYTSLVHGPHCPQRTLFIHIPVNSCPKQIALCLEHMVRICLQQLKRSS